MVGGYRSLLGAGVQSLLDHAHQGIVNTGVELLSRINLEMLEGRQRLERLTVGTLGSKCIEGVGGAQDPRTHRNGFTRQAERIAGAIPALVVVLDVLQGFLDVKQGCEDVETDLNVPLDVLE